MPTLTLSSALHPAVARTLRDEETVCLHLYRAKMASIASLAIVVNIRDAHGRGQQFVVLCPTLSHPPVPSSTLNCADCLDRPPLVPRLDVCRVSSLQFDAWAGRVTLGLPLCPFVHAGRLCVPRNLGGGPARPCPSPYPGSSPVPALPCAPHTSPLRTTSRLSPSPSTPSSAPATRTLPKSSRGPHSNLGLSQWR